MRHTRSALASSAVLAIALSTLATVSPAVAADEFDPYSIVAGQGLLLDESAQASLDARTLAPAPLTPLSAPDSDLDAATLDKVDSDALSEVDPGALEAIAIAPANAENLTISAKQYAEVAEAENYAYVTGKNDLGTNASFAVLRDASAPTTYAFKVGDGTHTLLPKADGTIVVANADGEFVNYILPAWATDANGTSLPTSYTVDGSTITQTIDTTGAAFPVIADPSTGCGVPWCSVYFTRSETHSIGFDNDITAGVLVGGCAVINAWAGVACGLAAVGYVQSAKGYYNNGNCLGVFFAFIPLGPGFVHHNPFEEPRSSNRC